MQNFVTNSAWVFAGRPLLYSQGKVIRNDHQDNADKGQKYPYTGSCLYELV